MGNSNSNNKENACDNIASIEQKNVNSVDKSHKDKDKRAVAQDIYPLTLYVLQFCDWRERGYAGCLSRAYRSYMTSDLGYKWLMKRLVEERGLYSPFKLFPGYSWITLFLELYDQRDIWYIPYVDEEGANDTTYTKNALFKINVYARFKPLDKDIPQDEGFNITLPLHQRLGLIRLSHGVKTRKESLRILKEEGSWFGKKWADIENKKKQLQDKQNSIGNPEKLMASVQNIDAGTGRVVMAAPDIGIREFVYDGVFQPTVTQKQVYETVAQKLVADVVNGYNATVIMYGQTGSGKTYTMFGESDFHSKTEDMGIVQRSCQEILSSVQLRRAKGIHTKVSISYIEIYGDVVTDLLKNGQRCGHSRVAAQQFVLSGAAEQEIETIEDVNKLLEEGESQKRRAATAMNERSSRAHSLFIVSLHQISDNSDVQIHSKLFLADLGGSEQVKKSKVAPGTTQESVGFEFSDRMRETVYINLGLLALKQCIDSLNNRSPYVPYKDSRLTMLLSAGLGGHSKTSVVVCCNMENRHATETIATLRFAEQCALIEMSVRNNATILAGVLNQIAQEIIELEAAIKKKERWETIEVYRQDDLAEEGTIEAALGGKERKLVTVLRGAEEERKKLAELLIRRAQLTGCPVEEATELVQFGRAENYNIGSSYNPEIEEEKENVRFKDVVEESKVPVAVKSRGKKWVSGQDIVVSQEELEKQARKIRRNKLVYSGLS